MKKGQKVFILLQLDTLIFVTLVILRLKLTVHVAKSN